MDVVILDWLTNLQVPELFGIAALLLHLAAYGIYAREVFHERIRPNVIVWLMWLFGGVVEYVTYNAITGSHWSTDALPIACVVGIGSITIAIAAAQIRNFFQKNEFSFHKPIISDYYLVGFDVAAIVYWLLGGGAVAANFIAVSTSIITFIPLWRTTYQHPQGEQPLPWALWTCAYFCMCMAVITGTGAGEIGLYIFPIYYLLLHLVVLILSLRTKTA